jgi:putative SOS response-associated peptidase YedK
MCGRFALFASGEELAQRYPFVQMALFDARYNLAPTQSVPAVRSSDAGLRAALFRWGLIPATKPLGDQSLLGAKALRSLTALPQTLHKQSKRS